MRWNLIFANGLALSFIHWPVLPSEAYWLCLLLLLSLFAWRWPSLRHAAVLLMVTLALLWYQGQRLLSAQLPAACDGLEVELTFQVEQVHSRELLPHVQGLRFEVVPHTIAHQSDCMDLALAGRRLRLGWWQKTLPELEVGDQWRGTVSLNRPRGQRNWYADDYQLWLMREGVYATGKVLSVERLNKTTSQSVRIRWQNFLIQHLPLDQAAVLIALSTGERIWLSDELSEALIQSGTAHLLAISGLHIGLAALLGFWLGRGLFALWVWCLPARLGSWLNQIHAARCCALLAAAVYCWFGGAGISTQRAFAMLCLYFGVQLFSRQWRALDICLVAMWVLLLINPLEASAPGFYLSFFAVFCLLTLAQARAGMVAKGVALVRMQLWLAFAMLPLSLWFFSGFSLVSVLANLVAVPWVSFVTVPATLVSTILFACDLNSFTYPLWIAAHSVQWFLDFLVVLAQTLAQHEVPQWQRLWLSAWTLGLLGVFLVGWITPLPARVKSIGLLFIAVLVSWSWQQEIRLANARERIVVFDVGQGLSVLVESGGQRLLYDTGPPFGSRTSAMARIVLPFFQRSAVTELNYAIVSHADADHAGGLAELQANGPEVQQWILGEPMPGVVAQACDQPRTLPMGREGSFRVIAAGRMGEGNDSSCVLEVRLPWAYLLLTGDISVARELMLSRRLSPYSPAYLLAGHHGSQTSSSFGLLSRFAGAEFIVSAGYRNSYGHPHPKVMQRARSLGLYPVNTADLGALMYQPDGAGRVQVLRLREASPRFWQ